jgi:hypothetical protein
MVRSPWRMDCFKQYLPSPVGFSSTPLAPNAGAHLLPEAGAQRTLEAVRCSALLGSGACPAPVYAFCQRLP